MNRIGLGSIIVGIVLGCANTRTRAEDLTAEQFLRFVRSQQEMIKDVAFAFEGERRYLGPPDQNFVPLVTYQGRYALRSDGASFEEIYYDRGVDPYNSHVIRIMIGGRGTMAVLPPGFEGDLRPHTMTSGGGPGALFHTESPETWNFLWRLQSLREAPDFGYRFVGWEDLDGHRCARVEFAPHPGAMTRVLQELWIDIERGAYPLRIRTSDQGQTVYLVDQIKIGQYELPSGESIWFPTGGRYGKYYHRGEYTADPVVEVTSYVLEGTLTFNQGLPDGVFQVKGDAFRPRFTALPPKPARKPGSANPRSDFVAAEERLDRALADPARRAAEKDASATTRAEAARGTIPAWGLGILGGLALLIAGFFAWRRFAAASL